MARSRFLTYLAFAFICLLSACSEGKPGYDHEEAVRRVLEVQRLQNLNPGNSEAVPLMEAIIDSMGRSGKDGCYFGAINVLIDRLFADGRYAEADSLAIRMHKEAFQADDSLSMAMAKRVRAQILFKLSQSDRALEEIQSAMPYVSDPLASGTAFGTATSIDEWTHIIARANSDSTLMDEAGERYADTVERGLSGLSLPDSTCHYRVTALAFMADNNLRDNRPQQASILLDSASRLLRPDLPARAYEHFYETRCRLRAAEGNFTGALADVDTLLSTHRCFPWFYLRDLQLKAEVENLADRHEESSRTYTRYIAYHDSLSKRLTDRRLQDLTLLYRSELDRKEKKANTIRLFGLGSVTLLLLILFGVALRHAMAERKRNRLLVERLHEYDRANHTLIEKVSESTSPEDADDTLILRLDRHMLADRPYTDPALGRNELAEFLGIPQDALAQLIRSEHDLTVHAYINSYRAEEARRVLDSEPDTTIADIASRLGFGTARTLQRAFKERFDMTPTQYRDASEALRSTDNQ